MGGGGQSGGGGGDGDHCMLCPHIITNSTRNTGPGFDSQRHHLSFILFAVSKVYGE